MTETDRITLLNEAAVFMARLWKKISAPVSYEHVTSVDGVRVRVSVEYGDEAMREAAKPKDADALKRLEEFMSDRSADA